MELHIRLERRGDLSVQIYRQIREAIMDGRLRPGERLPPTRELARRLEISRNTAGVAYELLAADGILVGRVGDGSYVRGAPRGRAVARGALRGAIVARTVWKRVPDLIQPLLEAKTYDYDFSVGVPDTSFFPMTEWRRLMAREMRSWAGQTGYQHPAGNESLRAAIARHVGVSRAVRAVADDVIVTQGAQQAFDLIGRVLISPGTCVGVEEPGYPFVRALFQTMGARVVGVPVDQEGLKVDSIPPSARILYVTPSHQFPLGYAISLQRRAQLLDWAERKGALLIEDDYDSEFRFSGRPLDPLQGLDRSGCVLYVGSFSKVLMPALRMGFLIAPSSLRPALLAAKYLSDFHSDSVKQMAMARFIERGILAKHIRKINREYAMRCSLILAVLERHLGRWLRAIPAASGIHLTAELIASRKAVDMERVVLEAEKHGVRVESLEKYYAHRPAKAGLVIGYGRIPTDRIEEGLRRIGESFAVSWKR